MAFRRTLALALSAAVVLAGCLARSTEVEACPEHAPVEGTGIPDCIRGNADALVSARVGEHRFLDHYAFNANLSEAVPPDPACATPNASCLPWVRDGYYLVVYDFRVPEKPFVNETAEVVLDLAGRLVAERRMSGVPTCRWEPWECWFTVDETQAIEIARADGLADGVCPWRTSFHWYHGDTAREQTFVWTVANTLRSGWNNASGETLVIDANSGRKMHRLDWQMFIDRTGPMPEGWSGPECLA